MNQNTLARLAGLFYLLLVLTGIFSLLYVPSQLIDFDNPAQTTANIQTHDVLFRLMAVISLLCYTFFILLIWALFSLLRSVNRDYAIIMAALAGTSIPVAVFSVHYLFRILSVIQGIGSLPAPGDVVLENQVMYLFNAYANGLFVADFFWSLWLFPFGVLVFRSGFLPRWLGVLLITGATAYCIHTISRMVFPGVTIVDPLRTVASIAEIGTCLWLLVMGTKKSESKSNQSQRPLA